MKALIVHSHIFQYDKEGTFYSNGQYPYTLIKKRYLEYFDEVAIAARAMKMVDTTELNVSSGTGVKHYVLPSITNPRNYRKNNKNLKNELYFMIKNSDIVIARMPSAHAYKAIKIAMYLKKPYVVEVVGDVLTSFWYHGNILGKFLAPLTYWNYRKIISRSPNIIYVTKEYLQKRYPHSKDALVTNASNVNIPYFSNEVTERRIKQVLDTKKKKKIRIGMIASYSSKYKGIDTAIKSIKLLNNKGIDCELKVLGLGDNRWLIKLADELNIQERIVFSGAVKGGEEVYNWLDKLDIYIQPSLTEGLPRALIEAMGRGLPCIGSSVGGIPELLDRKFIHKPKSDKELSNVIEYLINNNDVMIHQSRTNFLKAKNYTEEVLNERRKSFWEEFFSREFGGN